MTPAWLVQGIGFAAAAGTTFSLLPQLVRIRRLRSARDVSLGMFLLFSLGVLLWLIYGWMVHSWPVIVANGITLVFSISILVLKVKYDREAALPVIETVERTPPSVKE